MDRRNILPDSQEFIDLIDHAPILEPVVELMGPYIQLSMAEAIVRPPNPDDQGYIHTDGGEALRRIPRERDELAAADQGAVLPDRPPQARQRQLHPVSRQPSAALSRGG